MFWYYAAKQVGANYSLTTIINIFTLVKCDLKVEPPISWRLLS